MGILLTCMFYEPTHLTDVLFTPLSVKMFIQSTFQFLAIVDNCLTIYFNP